MHSQIGFRSSSFVQCTSTAESCISCSHLPEINVDGIRLQCYFGVPITSLPFKRVPNKCLQGKLGIVELETFEEKKLKLQKAMGEKLNENEGLDQTAQQRRADIIK